MDRCSPFWLSATSSGSMANWSPSRSAASSSMILRARSCSRRELRSSAEATGVPLQSLNRELLHLRDDEGAYARSSY